MSTQQSQAGCGCGPDPCTCGPATQAWPRGRCACGQVPCRCSASLVQPSGDVGAAPPAAQVYAEPVRPGTFFLEHAGQPFQTFAPLHAIHAHQCAFHKYHDDPSRHMEAHHFCAHLSEKVMQCVIYDKPDTRDAKLLGVEYIVGSDVFATLPDEEKAYWHPHAYEVQAGLLTMPGVPPLAEDQVMKKLINTYGKTWHLWQVDRGDALPIGPAKLMSSYRGPEEVPAAVVQRCDAKAGTSTAKIAARRAAFPHEPVDPRATA